MKKKKYNFLVFVLLFFIVGTIFCGCIISTGAISAEDLENKPSVDAEQPQEDVMTEIERPNLPTFRSAINYSFKKLKNCKNYKSHTSGFASATALNYGFKQDIFLKKQVDNTTNECYVRAETRKCIDLGANGAFEFYQNENQTSLRVGSFQEDDFVFSGSGDVYDNDKFADKWGFLPIQMISAVNFAFAKNTRMNFTGKEYILKFDILPANHCIDFGKLVRSVIKDNSIFPNFGITSYTIIINAYGILKSIHVSSSFSCDVSLWGLHFVVDGQYSAKETYYGFDEEMSVTKF